MKDLFLSNTTEIKFLNKISDNLKKCTSFCFSVSFIKMAGLVLLEKDIEEAILRGAKGRIITSTYQNFTDIPSLRKLLSWTKYNNFECHLEYKSYGECGFHTKGYLFEFDDCNEIIVGSSNITRFALLKNFEWNLSLNSKELFESYNKALEEFDAIWNKLPVLSNELIDKYRLDLEYAVVKWDMDYIDHVSSEVKINPMQKDALKELMRYRDMNVTKALVIAATGSGKTYLAAMDAKNYDAHRVLFIAHRDKILIDARKAFMNVFGAVKTYGLFIGEKKELDADFVFASNSMISKHLDIFNKSEFDYIVIDECHHSTASTYKKIIDYFNPGFLLGLTATPERMDNQDVFELFDKNVPYELRLRDAIIDGLVVPFHYYGIRDKLVNYGLKDHSSISREISKNINVQFIRDQIEDKREKNKKLKALAFCSSVQHSKMMAQELENVGYTTMSITSNCDIGERIKAIEDLQNDECKLNIICTCDLFNEGVDIPQLNMVLFLRPTESETIFIQQLGRGLRTYEGKEYLTVLDFIGNNYDRSIQIAMALGRLGQSSVIEKSYLMDLINTNFKSLNIPGVQINIDDLSKEEVIHYLTKVNFNRKDFLEKDYNNFKKYLKTESYPSHMDFLNCDFSPDLMRLMKCKINNKKNRSYYNFLKQINEESIPLFTENQIELIDNLSENLPLVRADEYLIIKQLLNDGEINLNKIISEDNHVCSETLENALYFLHKDKILINNKLNSEFSDSFELYLNDLLEYGLTRYEIEFGDYTGKFKLYGNYFKEQIQKVRLKNTTMYVRGTEFPDNDITYFYVGLNKTGLKKTSFDYKDKFISSKIFQWESVKDTTFESGDGLKLKENMKVELFIRKKEDEDEITLPFTYFGTGTIINPRNSCVDSLDKKSGIVKTHKTIMFDVILDNPVPREMWFDFEIKEDE